MRKLFSILLFLVSLPLFADTVYVIQLVNLTTNTVTPDNFYMSGYVNIASIGYRSYFAGGANPGQTANVQVGDSNPSSPIYSDILDTQGWNSSSQLSSHPLGNTAFTQSYSGGTVVVVATYTYDGTSVTSTSSIPVVSTNYPIVVQNNSTTPQIFTATWNGSPYAQMLLQPGQTWNFSTPSVEVSPLPGSGNMNVTSVPVQGGTTAGEDSSGNPVITFNNNNGGSGGGSGTFTASGGGGSSSSGSGGTGTGTVSGGVTNYFSVTNPNPLNASSFVSNIISFQPSTGNPAQEPTLQAGIGVAHADAQNLLNGLSALNSTIQNQTAVTTNYLGQILYWVSTNAGETWDLIHGLTNLASGSGALSNLTFNLSSNVWVGNFPSNYNQEITQQGISNLLAQSLGVTNFDDSDTNYSGTGIVYTVSASDTDAVAAASAAQAALGADTVTAINGLSNSVGQYLSQTVPDGSMPNFTISMPMCNVTLNLNPVTNFPWFFIFVHALMTWVTVVAFVTGCLKTLFDVLHDYAAAHSSQVPNMQGGNSGGTGGISPILPI